jgi:hypothetical protein
MNMSIKRLGVDFDPTKPLAKVVLANFYYPENSINVLLNPESIEFSIGVGIGKPQPVGWSNPIKQYSHTSDVVSGLELRINESVLARNIKTASGDKYPIYAISDYVSWISSFCYAMNPGLAPSPMIVHWPNVVTMVVVVDSMKVRFTRFNRSLQPVDGVVSLSISELRETFWSSLQQGKNGFLERTKTESDDGSPGTMLNPGQNSHS